MVAYVDTKKSIDCTCIKETVTHNGKTFRLVSRASFASEKKDAMFPFYDNHGTNADKFGSFWNPHIKSKPGKGIVSIPPNTFFVNGKSLNKIPGDMPYALNFKFDTHLDEALSASDDKVVLTSSQPPSEVFLKNLGETKTYYVPFFAVDDSEYSSQLEQFLHSPTYKVVRTSYLKFLYGMTTSPYAKEVADQAYDVTTGLVKGENYQTALGVTTGMSVTTSVKASAGVEGVASAEVGVAVTASIETSLSYSWGGSTTTSKQESRTPTYKVPPSCYSVIFQRTSEYQIFRKDGTPVGDVFTVGKFDFVQKIFKP